MKRFRDLKKPYRITIIAIAAILVILLTLVWVMFAIISLHYTDTFGYNGYNGTKVIAHRGYSGMYYDNTEQSFQAAADNPFFDGIETDIRRTKDGVWVCSHDDNPFKDKDVYITKSNYDDIKNLPLDVSNAQEGADLSIEYFIPTYEEYLEICASSGKIALIEIKGKYSSKDLTDPVNDAITLLGYNRALFGSFTLSSIESVLEIQRYARVLLFAGQSIVAYCFNNMGYNIGVNKKILNDTVIERAHENDTAVFVYTIIEENEYAEYEAMKVDYIITNYAFG